MKPKKKTGSKGTICNLDVPSDKQEVVRQHVTQRDQPSLDEVSVQKLVRSLRGSYKGRPSLSAMREREHRREDRIKARKFAKVLDLIAKG